MKTDNISIVNKKDMLPNDNKRILQNTLFMYVRMFLIMLVSLYTSRIILNTLGISDFGIYNVVGGIVVMFSFLNSAMSASTQRFLAIEIGKKDLDGLKKVFKTSVILHIIIAVILIVLAESIGVWFINSQLTIPTERLFAANWAFCSLLIVSEPSSKALKVGEVSSVPLF